MKSKVSIIKAISTLLIACFIASSVSVGAHAQNKEKLDKAIALYHHEDYEEALEAFEELRREDPESSEIAYYLGLTYRQLQDVASAKDEFKAAATLKPPVKAAIPELIDTLYQCNDIKQAKEWIAKAEKEDLAPAQVSFLKGIVLMKDDPEEAIRVFDETEKLDPSYKNTVAYYKGMSLVQAKRLDEAKDIFRKVAISDPTASLSRFANEYADVISRRQDYDKPFHASATVTLQYDDNVILQPVDDDVAVGIGNKGDWRSVVSTQLEYNYKPVDKFSVKGGWTLYTAKQFDLGFYDAISNDFSVIPSYTMEKSMLAFPMQYFHYCVNDKYYMSMVGFGPLYNAMLNRDNMAQFSFTHKRKYFNWQPNNDNEDMSSFDYSWSAGWFYFFTKMRDGFVNVRYAMNFEDSKGRNWTYMGNKITATAVIPVGKKMYWTVVGEYYRQDFQKVNSLYEKARTDDMLTISSLYSINIAKGLDVQLQYSYVNDAATIGVYKYSRQIYGASLKYKF